MARLSFRPWAGPDAGEGRGPAVGTRGSAFAGVAGAPAAGAGRAPSEAGPAPLDAQTSPAFSLLVSLQRAGAPLRHDCGGKALCGTCRVRVLSGAEGLSPMGERERLRLEAVGAPLDGSVRLACQARASRDAEIEALLGPAEGKGEGR